MTWLAAAPKEANEVPHAIMHDRFVSLGWDIGGGGVFSQINGYWGVGCGWYMWKAIYSYMSREKGGGLGCSEDGGGGVWIFSISSNLGLMCFCAGVDK